MKITHAASGEEREVAIDPVGESDFKKLTKKRYFFDWRQEATTAKLFKLHLSGDDDIKGIMAVIDHPSEARIEIRLLAESRENVVLKNEKVKKNKEYERIAGNMIAFAVRMAVKAYGEKACVSLKPKSEIKHHYMNEYGMQDAGLQVYLELTSLINILNKYTL
jgi:hypothetical protein